MTEEDILARVLFRDALMLVLDKPAGIAVHASGGVRGVTLDSYFDALRYGLPRRPELVHRLDRETSGCLVLGRHRKSIADLNQLFRDGAVEKIYLAVVEGAPAADEGEIDLPIGPKDKARGWHQKVDPEKGLPARTTYRVLARAKGHSLVEMNLHTGRTHQLRVHMAAIGCPILGDKLYGNGGPPKSAVADLGNMTRGTREHPSSMLHLHAWKTGVPLYKKRAPIRIEAPLPVHIATTLKELKISLGENGLSRV
jgi:tRNA pseudouridine32 synthase/23S rRNA pseudouridine746 synthase